MIKLVKDMQGRVVADTGTQIIHFNGTPYSRQEWHDDYEGAPTDGQAWVNGNGARVIRGGAWDNSLADGCGSAYRDQNSASLRYYFLGFRLLRTSPDH